VTAAAESSARIAAMQREAAALQTALAQATSRKEHLVELMEQKRGQVARLASEYDAVARDVQQVYDTSKGWYVAPPPPA